MAGPQRNVLITGGAKRVGAAIARRLAAAGWGVVLHHNLSRAEAAALAAELPLAWTIGADLSDAEAAAALPARAAALCGGLTALVNNASLFEYDTPQSFDAAGFVRHMAVNLLAPALLVRGLAEQLPEGVQGAVVHLLDNRLYAPNPDYFTYALSKYGLLGMMEMQALGFAPRLRVNGVAPGIALVSGHQTDEEFRRAHVNNPLGRGVTPTDIAEAVAFLLEAPSITAEVIVVDSGQRLRRRGRDVAFPA
ncbi:MAG: SDR family oxidoreductase [Rhodovarius sp.]|nr:SDR family oxidoreductase [Rhodovarius sp.]MDW8314700.1 SDR family oxidoreductase [Rhodovarius sp.]